jgi:hypothetical protein
MSDGSESIITRVQAADSCLMFGHMIAQAIAADIDPVSLGDCAPDRSDLSRNTAKKMLTHFVSSHNQLPPPSAFPRLPRWR